MLERWNVFTRFVDDSRICLSNNAAERAVHGVDLDGVSAILRLRSCRRDVQPDGHRGDERSGSASVAPGVLVRIAAHPVH